MKQRFGVLPTIGLAVCISVLTFADTKPSPMPNLKRIELPGTYGGHLQDVFRDGDSLYWTHTSDVFRTDLTGKILAHTTTPGLHAAGCGTRDGKLYVAMCDMGKWAKQGKPPTDPLQIRVFDALTLEKLDDIFLTDCDYAGSFTFLKDGSALVGCLRAKELAADEVRFHHVDKNFKCLKTYTLKNLLVPMGIEVIHTHGDSIYLAIYPGNKSGYKRGILVELDQNFNEVKRRDINGTYGMVFDEPYVWLGGVVWKNGKGQGYLTRAPMWK